MFLKIFHLMLYPMQNLMNGFFDPFYGRGTTNFAARLKGLPSIGIDID